MEKVLDGIENIIVYINDDIIHTATHEHHLQVLDQVLAKLEQHQLKINLAKCFFGDTEVAYLGLVLTPEGIRPGNCSATCRRRPICDKFDNSLDSAISSETKSRILLSYHNLFIE